jgi:TRAP-type C4-dicarboxylate transport system permease small subunit
MSTTEGIGFSGQKLFQWFSRMSSLISTLGAAIASLMLMASVFLVAYGAIFRYVGVSTVGIDELEGFFMVGIAFLPLGFVLMKGKHISIDILVRKAGSKTRSALFLVCNCMASLFYCGILAWSGMWLINESYSLHSLSTTLRLPIFIPQVFLLVGTLTLIIVILFNLTSSVMICFGGCNENMEKEVGSDDHS